jgi:AcrR family transcriptional regulator
MFRSVIDVTPDHGLISLRFRPMARPRSDEAREAAIEATVDVVLEHGVAGVTFEEVAARSGVAKSTLYRHFGTKQAMVVAAAMSCYAEQPTPDTGDLEQDLRDCFDKGRALEDERRLPDIMPALLAASERDEDLQVVVSRMHEEKRRPLLTVLKLAQLRGEIGMDVDLDVFVSMLIGPFVLKRVILREEITPELREAVIQTAATALRATASTPVLA